MENLPIKSDKKFKYSITFQTFDEESLEVGETHNHGFIETDEVDTIGEILYEANSDYGIYMPVSFGTWESTQPQEDADYFEKGIRMYYGLHIKNEDGTEISQEENDFITFLLSDGRYEINKFREFAVGGLVVGAIAIGGLITYLYFKDKKPKTSKTSKTSKSSKKVQKPQNSSRSIKTSQDSSRNIKTSQDEKISKGNRAKSVTHRINGKDRRFPIKDAWRKEHNIENKSEDYEVPQRRRKKRVSYADGGTADDYFTMKDGSKMSKNEWYQKMEEKLGFEKFAERQLKDAQFGRDINAPLNELTHNRLDKKAVIGKNSITISSYTPNYKRHLDSITLYSIKELNDYLNKNEILSNGGGVKGFAGGGEADDEEIQYHDREDFYSKNPRFPRRIEITKEQYNKNKEFISNQKWIGNIVDEDGYEDNNGIQFVEFDIEVDQKSSWDMYGWINENIPSSDRRIFVHDRSFLSYAKGGGINVGYNVFNYTDNIYATDEVFKTKALANKFIKEFRNRFANQGYYRDNRMNKINIQDIDLLAIPSDFNPLNKYADGGEAGLKEGVYNVNRYTLTLKKESGDNWKVTIYDNVKKATKIDKVLPQNLAVLESLKIGKVFADGGETKLNKNIMKKGGQADEKLISIAKAIFNANEDNGKIATNFGKKTFDGFVEMIKQNDAYDIYYNIWQENAEGKYIATTYGDKTYIGLLEMLRSAKNEDEYAGGGKVKGINKKAEKLLEQSINYRWVDTDMGSGWSFELESPLDRSVFNIIEEHTYLDEFSPEDAGFEDWDNESKEQQEYYYKEWKEEFYQGAFENFKEKCMKHLDDFVEYIQQAKEYQDEMNEYADGGQADDDDYDYANYGNGGIMADGRIILRDFNGVGGNKYKTYQLIKDDRDSDGKPYYTLVEKPNGKIMAQGDDFNEVNNVANLFSGKFADGGNVKSKKPKMVRMQFEEEEYEYADGGSVGDLVEVKLKGNRIVTGKIESLNPFKIRTDSTSVQTIPNPYIESIKKVKSFADGGRVTKYVALYYVQGNYDGQGFEDLTAHDNRKDAIEEMRWYDDNESYPHRVIERRVLRSDYEKGDFADGGSADLDYSDIFNVLKSKIDDAIDEIPMAYENSSSFTSEEIEHESRDGFIPYTDGGYEARWFEYILGMFGNGYNLPTKQLDDEMNRQIDYNLDSAKENFIENYPEIVEELGEENIDYNSLYEAGYGEEAEELSNDESEMMSEDTIMMRIFANYYNPENSRAVDGKHTIRLFGDVNLESPYHRTGNLDDSYEFEFTFDSIDVLETEIAIGIAYIISWFEGDMYNDSDTEMKVRRMAKGGELAKPISFTEEKKGLYYVQFSDDSNVLVDFTLPDFADQRTKKYIFQQAIHNYKRELEEERPYQVYNYDTQNVEGYFDNEIEAEEFASQFKNATIYDIRKYAGGGETRDEAINKKLGIPNWDGAGVDGWYEDLIDVYANESEKFLNKLKKKKNVNYDDVIELADLIGQDLTDGGNDFIDEDNLEWSDDSAMQVCYALAEKWLEASKIKFEYANGGDVYTKPMPTTTPITKPKPKKGNPYAPKHNPRPKASYINLSSKK